MRKSDKRCNEQTFKAKRDYWESLRRNPFYLKDFKYLAEYVARDDSSPEEAIKITSAMARHYRLNTMLPFTSNFSDKIAYQIRYADTMIKLKVHEGYWPLHRASFGYICDANDKGPVIAPYKRSEGLIFGRYLQVCVDITQKKENVLAQVSDAINMARTVLIDDITPASEKNTRHRPEDNELAFEAWDRYHIKHMKYFEIGHELWNIKDKEQATKRASDAVSRAQKLIDLVAESAFIDQKINI